MLESDAAVASQPVVQTHLPTVSTRSVPASTPDRDDGDLLRPLDTFPRRHLGSSAAGIEQMLKLVGYPSLDALIDTAVPQNIRLAGGLRIPLALSESEALNELRRIASRNHVSRSYLGGGYSDCITPPVIQRNILENPGWYTAYTPYQAEIAQGRLEALLNFQTMICDLTGLDISNASLLDEATAAAEAMHLAFAARGETGKRQAFFVSQDCHAQTIAVVQTRAWPLEIEVVVGDHRETKLDGRFFGALVQYPGTNGRICSFAEFFQDVHAAGALAIVAADPLALCLLQPPGEFGADVAVGTTQRFGVPLGYGGPHAGYLAVRDEYKRLMPGRLVGVSKDSHGKPAYRLALQTREQHIRRDKATSNICTAQVLLAVIASMYAVYHGPDGLRQIARRVHHLTSLLAAGLRRLGFEIADEPFFDTIQVKVGTGRAAAIYQAAQAKGINLREAGGDTLGVSLDETVTLTDLQDLWTVFHGGETGGFDPAAFAAELTGVRAGEYPQGLARRSAFLTHPVFNRFHTETEMLRYLRRLEARDLSLTTSMIPLGSCTKCFP